MFKSLSKLTAKLTDTPIEKLQKICSSEGQVSKLAELLKRHPFNVNEVRFEGWTCLHLCAFHGFDDCVSFLLTSVEPKANVLLTLEDDGSTALHKACLNNHTNVVRSILACCGGGSGGDGKAARTSGSGKGKGGAGGGGGVTRITPLCAFCSSRAPKRATRPFTFASMTISSPCANCCSKGGPT